MLTSTFERENQNGPDIHLKMKKKLNGLKNVNVISFWDVLYGDAWFMVFV